jgi:hypothetical protein
MDYLTYLIGKPCLEVSSFGSLRYFRRENAPAGSTDFCADGCTVECDCPYSALKHYVAPPDGLNWWSNRCGTARDALPCAMSSAAASSGQ